MLYTQALKPYVLRLVHISRVCYRILSAIDALILFDRFAIPPRFGPPASGAFRLHTGHGGFTLCNFPPSKKTNEMCCATGRGNRVGTHGEPPHSSAPSSASTGIPTVAAPCAKALAGAAHASRQPGLKKGSSLMLYAPG